MPAKPRSIDEYLAGLSAEKRAALQKLRRAIRTTAPTAVECITYGMPAFRWNGRMLVAFGASANHCALYPWSSATIRALRTELASYDTSPGTIRFPANKPLPAWLVRKLVKARMAESEVARRPRKSRGAASK